MQRIDNPRRIAGSSSITNTRDLPIRILMIPHAHPQTQVLHREDEWRVEIENCVDDPAAPPLPPILNSQLPAGLSVPSVVESLSLLELDTLLPACSRTLRIMAESSVFAAAGCVAARAFTFSARYFTLSALSLLICCWMPPAPCPGSPATPCARVIHLAHVLGRFSALSSSSFTWPSLTASTRSQLLLRNWPILGHGPLHTADPIEDLAAFAS
jgi:hypothetical protein